jgi:hypothetical protein
LAAENHFFIVQNALFYLPFFGKTASFALPARRTFPLPQLFFLPGRRVTNQPLVDFY